MKTMSKLMLLVILVLTLSIFVQPKSGLCASVCEYFVCPFIGEEFIISPKDGLIENVTIEIKIIDWYVVTGYPYKCFHRGIVVIDKPIKKSSNCTIVFDTTKAYEEGGPITVNITADDGSVFEGTLDGATGEMKLSLQITGDGTSGGFTLFPNPPPAP